MKRAWKAALAVPLAAMMLLAGWLRWWPPAPDLPPPQAAPWPQPSPGLVLVLGAGGPRGVAHLGVLKALEDMRIRPDAVVGASAGAIVGALWLSGRTASQIESLLDDEPLWWQWLDWSGDFSFRLRGDALADWARRRAAPQLQDLSKPFAAVATDETTGRSVAFTQGDLGRALHASSATPSLMAPAFIGGRAFIDGDRSSPVPVHAARALGARRVIAVDVSARLESTPHDVPPEWREGDLRMRRLADAQTRDADVLIHPDLGYYAGGSRAYRTRVIAIAYEATMNQAARLQQLTSPSQ